MRDAIQEIIIEELHRLRDEIDNPALDNPDKTTRLLGPDGTLDSMGLVTLVIAIEERLAEKFGVNISVVDERAMSLKVSPFINVDRLSRFIESRIQEEKNV